MARFYSYFVVSVLLIRVDFVWFVGYCVAARLCWFSVLYFEFGWLFNDCLCLNLGWWLFVARFVFCWVGGLYVCKVHVCYGRLLYAIGLGCFCCLFTCLVCWVFVLVAVIMFDVKLVMLNLYIVCVWLFVCVCLCYLLLIVVVGACL